jgi:hypothetical protein
MTNRRTVELLISGCANTVVGVYVILFGTPLGLFIGAIAAGIGLITLLTIADEFKPASGR